MSQEAGVSGVVAAGNGVAQLASGVLFAVVVDGCAAQSGLWHIQQKSIVLRKWKPGLLMDELKLDSTLVGIKLRHVPLELYSQQGLSYVASAMKPLYFDRAIVLMQQLEFANVCVEVDAKEDIPASVLVDLGKENLVFVIVENVWSPPRLEVALQAISVNDKVEPVDKSAPGSCSGVLQEREYDIMRSLPVHLESSNKFDALGDSYGEVSGVKIDIVE
ncbi:hypothetical protein V6N13_037950 [Hibiscus sabdariffa]